MPLSKEIVMRRILLSTLVLACSVVLAGPAACAKPAPSGGGSASGIFDSVNSSNVSGNVTLHGLSSGTRISVRLSNLQPDVEYIASWSTTVACDMGNLPPAGAFFRFRGSKKGTAAFTVDVSAPLSSIHSVAIQVGNGLALVGCAPVN